MPTKSKLLSARTVATITKPGLHADGDSLYLAVTATGAKSWRFIWRSGPKRREMGLGALSSVSLSAAREAAAIARAMVAKGQDPIVVRNASRTADRPASFGDVMEDHLATKVIGLRNPKHRAQWRSTLECYASPLLPMSVASVGTNDVLSVLKPIWTEKPETASRVRGRIESILNAAKARGLRSGENPAAWRGHLANLLPARAKLSRSHFAAMPYKDLADLMGKLAVSESISALCLSWTILTACRSNEARGAKWSEVDLDVAIWTIPAARTKTAKPHRVPLSTAANAILRTVKPLATSREALLFPGGKTNRPLSDVAVTKALRRYDDTATVHGMRSAFRDWAGEVTHYPREIAEEALAHVVGDATERAYRRGDALEKRRRLMTDWAAFVTAAPTGNIVSLRA